MISFHYRLTSYKSFLEQFALLLDTKLEEDTLILPEKVGNGFLKVVHLNNALEAVIYELTFNDDLLLKRIRDNQEFYTLNLDEVESYNSFSIAIDSEILSSSGKSSAFYLTSFLYDVENILHKKSTLRGVRILLPVEWMKKYLQLNDKEDVLEKYVRLKTAGIWNKPINEDVKLLLTQILNERETPLLFYQNKIMRVIEDFFQWLYSEMQSIDHTKGINRQDIESAQKVEAILTNDITVIPPTIKQMAKQVAMSESKLKKIFKAVYGMPPYEYYQKQRMQKAKILLLTGNYSIKDVGYTLGYSNLSNFTLAFKKEFGKKPSEIVKEALHKRF